MRRRQRLLDEEDDINMTPMLDIVFIMLIFFIVTASFVRESGLELQSPGPKSDTPPSGENKTLLIVIDENDRIWVENRIIDVRAVRANIARAIAKNSSLSSVVIQTAGESRNELLVKVMDAARLSGFANVSILEG